MIDTSMLAYGTVNQVSGRHLVLLALRDMYPYGDTDKAIYDYIRTQGRYISPSGERTRRRELERYGYVARDGYELSKAGRRCHVFVITDKGMDYITNVYEEDYEWGD